MELLFRADAEVSMKRDGRTLAHNTLEEMRVMAVQRMKSVRLRWPPPSGGIGYGPSSAVRWHVGEAKA